MLGPEHARANNDGQHTYINGRWVKLPPELAVMANSWFRSAVMRHAAASQPDQASGRPSYAAAAGSSRLGTTGAVYPSYLLLLECPTGDVVVDGESTPTHCCS